jgi:hypothetical protein
MTPCQGGEVPEHLGRKDCMSLKEKEVFGVERSHGFEEDHMGKKVHSLELVKFHELFAVEKMLMKNKLLLVTHSIHGKLTRTMKKTGRKMGIQDLTDIQH